MSLSVRSKRFEVSQATPVPERPKIWVEGQQQPKFAVKAYVAASLGMARRDLAPAILQAERRLDAWAKCRATGDARLDVAPIGALSRILPSQQTAARWALGLANLLRSSHAVLVPVTVAEPVLAVRDQVRSRATSSHLRLKGATADPTAATGPAKETSRGTLLQARPEAPSGKAFDRAPSPQDLTGPVRHGRLHRLGARSLLRLLMVCAIPGGAVGALLYHLSGGDLANWS